MALGAHNNVHAPDKAVAWKSRRRSLMMNQNIPFRYKLSGAPGYSAEGSVPPGDAGELGPPGLAG